MSGNEVAPDALGARILRLERSLHRTRVTLAGLLAALGLFVLVAWRAPDEVRTQRLILTGEGDSAALVLRAVPSSGGPGLILETPGGQPIMTLGGDAVRPVRR